MGIFANTTLVFGNKKPGCILKEKICFINKVYSY